MMRSLLLAAFVLALLGGSSRAQEAKIPFMPGGSTGLPAFPLDGDAKPAPVHRADDSDDRTLGQMVVLGLLAPFLIPYEAFDNNFGQNARFMRYPYCDHFPGFLWTAQQADDPPDGHPTPEPPGCSSWSSRALLEDGYDIDRVNRVGLRLTVDSESRFGLTSNWNWYHETFWCGCTYDFLLGDTNLTYRFAQNENVAFYAGVGCRYFADGTGGNAGVNVLYGCDIFPVRPVVVSLLVDGGNLGAVGVIHWRATAGATVHGMEFLAGYDFMRIGCVDLQGPMLGLRFWF